MALLNQGVMQGHSSRLGYDRCFIDDDIAQSVSPLLYTLNTNRINNCDACLSVFGPRSGHNGYGVSSTVGHTTTPSQDLVDVESVLLNRNVVASKCRDGKVNDIDVTQFRLQHARTCNDFLDPVATHLTNPPQNYREMAINRFYDLPTPPQAVIYWDSAVNTQLESKDNFFEKQPFLRAFDPTLPREYKGKNTCNYSTRTKFPSNNNCPQKP